MDTLIDAVAPKRRQAITAATDVAQNAAARLWRGPCGSRPLSVCTASAGVKRSQRKPAWNGMMTVHETLPSRRAVDDGRHNPLHPATAAARLDRPRHRTSRGSADRRCRRIDAVLSRQCLLARRRHADGQYAKWNRRHRCREDRHRRSKAANRRSRRARRVLCPADARDLLRRRRQCRWPRWRDAQGREHRHQANPRRAKRPWTGERGREPVGRQERERRRP